MVAPSSLTLLDGSNRPEHAFLAASDHCAYLSQYSSGRDYRADHCNQLLRNFKCRPSAARIDPRRRHYKQQAIATLALWLRHAVPREQAEECTWVPIPPSKRRGDPDFDDRLPRTLGLAFAGYDVDVRSLLYQVQSTVPDHSHPSRLSVEALYGNLRLDLQSLGCRPLRTCIALFDDLLTSGKHYRCCERRLRQTLPSTPIAGVFLMRRVLRRCRHGHGCAA